MNKVSKIFFIISCFACIACFFVYIFFPRNKEYLIIFDSAGGTEVKSQIVKNGEYVIMPEPPMKDDYIFEGWYLENQRYDFKTKVTANITLTAKWQEDTNLKKYEIKFDSAGGTKIESQMVKENEQVLEPTNPIKEGFMFEGWYLENQRYDFNTKVTANITLTAKWRENTNLKKYEVKFDSAGGNSIVSQTILENETAIQPENPTKTGYKFVEWQLNGKKYNFNTKITGDITLKAIWKKVVIYVVSFDSNGGTEYESQKVENGNKVVNPGTPKRNDYVFTGWMLDGKVYDFNSLVTRNITLTATWRELIKYNVSFDSAGGTNVKSQVVIEGNKVIVPTPPTRDGYKFLGWTLNGIDYNFNNVVSNNITLKANWTELPSENLLNLQKMIENIEKSNIKIGNLNDDILGQINIVNGCSVNINNLPNQIEREVDDKLHLINFEVVCGTEKTTKEKNIIILASPYKYTKVMNNNMLNYDVSIINGNWNGNAKLFLGTGGSFNVIDRKAIVEINKIENNPVFLMKFNDDAKTIYHVPFAG